MWDIEQFGALLLMMMLRCMAGGITLSRVTFTPLAGFFKEFREHMLSFCSSLVMIRFAPNMLHVECMFFRTIPLVFALLNYGPGCFSQQVQEVVAPWVWLTDPVYLPWSSFKLGPILNLCFSDGILVLFLLDDVR